MDPKRVYQQSEDKQRIVIAGKNAPMISAMTRHVLNESKRDFDFVLQSSSEGPSRFSDAPLIIIQESEKPVESLLDYQHHIAVLGDVDPTQEQLFSKFADATPKGGTLIFPENGFIGSIGKKERSDLSSFSYKVYPHVVTNGQVTLLTTKGDKVPVRVKSGDANLKSVSAAKELLKKIGITSGQFYHAIANFEN